MSILPPEQKYVVENQPENITNTPTKACTKIDTTSKLQVIQAIDNGQCKADIAREYGVQPQTIAYIYKQKSSIIKKYTHRYKLLKEVCNLKLEQNLLHWFEQQYNVGDVITEQQLRNKALEILKPLSEEFTCIDDWLISFQTRHNISKYCPEDMHSELPKEEWKRFLKSFDTKEIYFGNLCALSHNFDYNSYLNGQNVDSYVSLLLVVNAVGTDKREAAVVGKELFEPEACVRSLPVHYYHCINSQVNYSVIDSYLSKWNTELISKGKCITLVLNLQSSITRNLLFGNIRIISSNDLNYTTNILDKIVECFKYHYRRLQITRNVTYGKDNSTFLDYVHMIGNAWYNVPQKYIQSLTLPPVEGSLYFNVKDNSENDLSLSRWCKLNNIPLNTEQCPSFLDRYILCDKKLSFIYCGQVDESLQAVEVLNNKTCQSTSGMEAYQAMKRLVCYLQGESAGGSIIKYAKYLENHIEYGALLQMHQIIASANDTT